MLISTTILSLILILVASFWFFLRKIDNSVNLLKTEYSYTAISSRGIQKIGLQSDNCLKEDDLSSTLLLFFILNEDGHFLFHRGINWHEIRCRLRAAFKDGRISGGSSITEQLAKNIFFGDKLSLLKSSHRLNLKRRITTAFYARSIERSFSKSEIFRLYASTIWFTVYGESGIEFAAKHYFDKSALDLNPIEVMFLAAIIPHPSKSHISLVETGEIPHFRWEIIFGKFCDARRILLKGFNIKDLSQLKSVSFRTMHETLLTLPDFNYSQFDNDTQLFIQCRSACDLYELRKLISNITKRVQGIAQKFNGAE